MRNITTLFVLIVTAVLIGGCTTTRKSYMVETQRLDKPPSGKALINFHRPSGYGGGAMVPIFNGDGKFICDLPGKTQFQYVCDPGDNLFMAWADQVSVVKVEAEAGRIYDIVVDVGMGWVQANIKLVALKAGDERRAEIPEFEQRETVISIDRNPHILEYEAEHQDKVAEIQADFLGGEKSDRLQVLTSADAR